MSNNLISSSDHKMVTLQQETEGNDTFNEIKKVEIFGVFEMGSIITNQFEFDVHSDYFFKLINNPTEIPSDQLRVNSLNELLLLKENCNMDSFSEILIKLIRSENEICEELKKLPNGGFAFYIHIDCLRLSSSLVNFISPEELIAVRNLDFSVSVPDTAELSENLNEDEKLLLYELALLAKDEPRSEINAPNELFLGPPLNEEIGLEWISKTLGKLKILGMIDFEGLPGLSHRLPIRVIKVKDKKAKDMAITLAEASRYNPLKTIKTNFKI